MTQERLRGLTPDELDSAQRALYESITSGKRAANRSRSMTAADGSLGGPFNAMLRQPAVGDALQRLGSAIRYETALDDASRELAILVVAARWDSAYEQYAHEPLARNAGVPDDIVTAVRERSEPAVTDPVQRVVVATAFALAERGDLTDSEYDIAVETLGESGIFELLTLVGYYATLALQLRVLRVSSPQG